MKVPPFKLDAWLAAHEFATRRFATTCASSTGPLWTLAELMALGGGGQADARRREAVLRAAAGQQTTARTHRVAARRRSRSCAGDDRRVRGADRADRLFAAPGASIVRADARRIRRCRCWRAPGACRCANTRCGRSTDSRRRRRACLSAVDASTRVVFVNTPHNPTGSVMPANEQRKLAEAAGVARHSAHRRRGVSPAVSRRADRQQRREAAQHHRARRFRQGVVDPGTAHRLADRCRRRSGARRCSTCAAISRSRGSPLTEAIGAHALAHADADTRPAALACPRPISRCSRSSCTSIARRSAGRRPPAAPRVSHGCAMDAMRGRCARRWRKAGVLAAPGDCFDMPAHLRLGVGALAERLPGRAGYFSFGARRALIAQHIGKIVGLDKSSDGARLSARNRKFEFRAIMTTSTAACARVIWCIALTTSGIPSTSTDDHRHGSQLN